MGDRKSKRCNIDDWKMDLLSQFAPKMLTLVFVWIHKVPLTCDVFQISLMKPIIEKLEEISGKNYNKKYRFDARDCGSSSKCNIFGS